MGMSYSNIPPPLIWLCQFPLEDANDTGGEERVEHGQQMVLTYCKCGTQYHDPTCSVGAVSVAVAVGCRHRLVAQALLGASVVVVCRLFVRSVALVPASQVFRHQSLLDVLANLLIAAGHLAVVPRRSQCGIWIL